jgi:hypothetical protein
MTFVLIPKEDRSRISCSATQSIAYADLRPGSLLSVKRFWSYITR